MYSQTRKPIWLWVYYIISFLLFIFGIIGTLTDKSGFAIIVTIPLILISILLAGISYGVYYWKSHNKKLIGNLILWPLFLISAGFLLWEIINIVIWYNVSGFSGWPLLIFTIVMSLLTLTLLIILNKKDK
ncbi:MAG: hypothetical protein AABX55_01700 [Nanoarchaeota archaeon]